MKFLIVGNGCREHAIARRLKKEGNEVISFQTRPNIGLENICSTNLIHPDYDRRSIVQVAKVNSVNAIVIGTEEAIFKGVTDLAEQESIPCYAPSLAASKLESDKLFAKKIIELTNHSLNIPHIQTSDSSKIYRFIDEVGFPFVLKSSKNASEKEIKIIFDPNKNSLEKIIGDYLKSSGDVILERYIKGKEFYVYCFTDQHNYYFPKVVKDYPFKLNCEKGDKTGGMGCVSVNGLLPYINDKDYNIACDCIARTLDYLKRIKGVSYKGLIVGQFIKSQDGIFFVEYDVRPGDPEIINVLESLDNDLTSIIMTTLEGNLETPRINGNCVVSVYHVPNSYPRSTSPQVFYLSEEIVNSEHIFFSDVRRENRKFVTGGSRSLVVMSKDKVLAVAKESALHKSINLNIGLFYRTDIGEF